MPDGSDFPNVSDTSIVPVTSWGSNANERLLAADGSGASPRQPGDQWLRKISLIVYSGGSAEGGGSSDGGLELSALRVNFQVTKNNLNSPNFLYAKVYNLSPVTQKKVHQYNRVQLAAGYQGAQYGMIFDGTVVMYVDGKENPVDTYIEIFAGDADSPLNAAKIAMTWPAGTLPSQKVKDGLGAASLPIGQVELKGEQPSLRSHTYIGPVRELIRTQQLAYQSDFHVDDGTAFVIPWNGYREGEVVYLAPNTGLVGVPKITPQGLEAQCLLNPKLRITSLVRIDATRYDKDGNALVGISGVPFQPGSDNSYSGVSTTFAATGQEFQFGAAAVSPSGVYKVLLLEHSGDTRGNPWYSNIVCAAAGENGADLPNTYVGTAQLRAITGASTLDTGGTGASAPATRRRR